MNHIVVLFFICRWPGENSIDLYVNLKPVQPAGGIKGQVQDAVIAQSRDYRAVVTAQKTETQMTYVRR